MNEPQRGPRESDVESGGSGSGALGMNRRICCGAGPKKKGEHRRDLGEGLAHRVTIPGRARAGGQSVTP
jgi:hypothetical protein